MVRKVGLLSNQKYEDGTSNSGGLFIQPTGNMRSKEEENADADCLPDHRRVCVGDPTGDRSDYEKGPNQIGHDG